MSGPLVALAANGPILCVVGARPNFMKMAPILRALSARSLPTLLLHTGQHYDPDMNDRLFRDLQLPVPDINLRVGSGSHAMQTAEIMRGFEPVVDTHRPSCVVVVGDVNSTLACALVAAKKGVAIAHVEAGLRSNDRRMPEEINRVLTDQIADRLYTTERSSTQNLQREGISRDKICFAGNVMIDSLFCSRELARNPHETLKSCGFDPEMTKGRNGFGVVTLHRPSNVDEPAVLRCILTAMDKISLRLPLIFALHPRTRANIDRFGLRSVLDPARTALLPPQGYLEMLGLMAAARVVLTDSGGLQEEATALGVPCLTLRSNTERPITVEQGTNTLVGTDPEAILHGVDEVLSGRGKRGQMPEMWDGRAADRISDDLHRWLRSNSGN